MCQWQKIALQSDHRVSPPTAFDCFTKQRAKVTQTIRNGHDPLEDADDDNPLRNILFTGKATSCLRSYATVENGLGISYIQF